MSYKFISIQTIMNVPFFQQIVIQTIQSKVVKEFRVYHF